MVLRHELAVLRRQIKRPLWRRRDKLFLAAMGRMLPRRAHRYDPEFRGGALSSTRAELGIAHQRIPPRSPNHNAVVERLYGTVLDECYSPAFHDAGSTGWPDIDHVLQDIVHRYNTRRANRGRYMKGRTPMQILELKR
jgi:transposase InsO family protein